MSAGPVPRSVAAEVVEHIGAALAASHYHGVVNGRVDADHIFVTDHGPLLTSPAVATGSRDPADDVSAFATLVDRMLTTAGEPLPPELAATLAGADNRDVDGLVAAVLPALSTEALVPVVSRNPYLGLRAFDESDRELFFGRDELTAKLLSRLAAQSHNRFLAVVGPSGSGKSSVIRAGLVPALRDGAVPGSESWYFTAMAPGPHPFDAFAAAISRVALSPIPGAARELRADPESLADVLRRAVDRNATLLLVIDQFEELFTQVQDPADCDRFLKLLAAATTDPKSALRIVVGLRADYYDRPLAHPEFGPMISDSVESVVPLTAGELEQVSPSSPGWRLASSQT
jgi:hypothetical protein